MPILSKSKLIILYERQNGGCEYCGCNLFQEAMCGRDLTIDHKIPLNKGGKDNLKNLGLVCKWCNSSKGDKTVKEFIEYLKPYLEGKLGREELKDYHQYKGLHKRFKGLMK